jgi:hypothetical protein
LQRGRRRGRLGASRAGDQPVEKRVDAEVEALVTGGHLPTDALQITVWVTLIPLALTFAMAFKLPMQAREEAGH